MVVIAEFSPGFSADRSRWRLTLDLAGLLVQEVEIYRNDDRSNNGPKREVVEVGQTFATSVLRRADELDFWSLDAENPSEVVTDVPSFALSIRSSDKARFYSPESVSWNAHQGLEGATHFMGCGI